MSIYILPTFLHISFGTDKKNLSENQGLLELVIISFIFMTFTFD